MLGTPRTTGSPAPGDPATDQPDNAPPEVALTLRDAALTIVDDTADTRIQVRDIQGTGSWAPGRLLLEQLTGESEGGRLEFTGQALRESGALRLEGRIQARAVPLRDHLGWLEPLFPLLSRSDSALEGTADLDVALATEGRSADALLDNLAGEGHLSVEGIDFASTPLARELSSALRLPARARLASARGPFQITGRIVHARDFLVQVGRTPIRLTGTTDLATGRVDYAVSTEQIARGLDQLANRLPSQAQTFLAEIQQTGGIDRLAAIRLTGTRDRLRLVLGPAAGPAATPGAATEPQGAERIEDVARRWIRRQRDHTLR
jgi:uncharacterized protein involved in outer membrane biogenesis